MEDIIVKWIKLVKQEFHFATEISFLLQEFYSFDRNNIPAKGRKCLYTAKLGEVMTIMVIYKMKLERAKDTTGIIHSMYIGLFGIKLAYINSMYNR